MRKMGRKQPLPTAMDEAHGLQILIECQRMELTPHFQSGYRENVQWILHTIVQYSLVQRFPSANTQRSNKASTHLVTSYIRSLRHVGIGSLHQIDKRPLLISRPSNQTVSCDTHLVNFPTRGEEILHQLHVFLRFFLHHPLFSSSCFYATVVIPYYSSFSLSSP